MVLYRDAIPANGAERRLITSISTTRAFRRTSDVANLQALCQPCGLAKGADPAGVA